MKNKKAKKNNPNRLKCQISGATRLSNKTYIAAKGEKHGVTGNVWASFYLCKEEYQKLVQYIVDFGFGAAAAKHGIDKDRLKKWLRYNGRGAFVQIAERIQDEMAVEMAA